MADRIDVFISSTSRDLTKFRARVKDVILEHHMFPIGMEEFQPTKDNALQKCYDELQNAEVFVGVYAHRYGYAPESHHAYTTTNGETRRGDGETAITHLEYLWAIERNLPMFLFVLADEDDEGEPVAWPLVHVEDEPGKSRLKAFKSHITGHHTVKFFHSPDDLAAKVATALANLSRENAAKPPSRSDFYKHIPIPTNYVPRTELLTELRLALLGDDDIALTSAIKATKALHGMGGIGKSVMARALCDDPTVQAAFPDGILWATLGSEVNEADIREKLRDWILALGGGIEENAPSLELLKSKLATLLESRACLLILDDVWRKKDAEAFRVMGARCRLMLTTRDAEVARGLGADVQSVPVMSVAESIALLDEWADGGLEATPQALKETITKRLGRLPLAIKLAGGQLKRKDPRAWLERFDARKLEDRRGEADDPHSSLERCFRLSFDDLRKTDRKLYVALAIFKEDEPILESAITRLWEGLDVLDPDDTGELIDDLAARALMEVAGARYPRAVVLHDLLRDFMAAELTDARAAHQALLEAYISTKVGEHWNTAPDDGYLYDHLGYHLKHAARIDEFHTLVTGSRDWMDARYRQSYGDHGYVKDIDLLLEDYKDVQGTDRIILHAQLATVRQVVNARVDIYTDEILETMVWVRREREAINHALLRNDTKKRFDGLLSIFRTLAERDQTPVVNLPDYQRLLVLVDKISDVSNKASALGAIAIEMAKAGQFEEGLRVAQSIKEASYKKVSHLCNIAVALVNTGQVKRGYEVFEEGLGVALSIENAYWKASALGAIAVEMAKAGQFEEGLRVAQSIEDMDKKAFALGAIAVEMANAGQIEEGLRVAQSIEYVYWKAFALGAIAVEIAKARQVEEGLRMAQSIENTYWKASVLGKIAVEMAKAGQIEEGLGAAQNIEDADKKGSALGAIAVEMAKAAQIEEGLRVAQSIENADKKASALGAIAVEMAKAAQIEEGLRVAQSIEDADKKASALGAIAVEMAKAGQIEHAKEVFDKGLRVAQSIEDADWKASALGAIAVEMAKGGQVEEGLRMAQSIEYASEKGSALGAIAVEMAKAGQMERTNEVFTEAVRVVQVIDDAHWKGSALGAIAVEMAKAGQMERANEVFTEGLRVVQSIKDADWKAVVLGAIAVEIAKAVQFEEGLRMAQSIEDVDWKAVVLGAIAVEMAKAGQFEEGLRVAQSIEDASKKSSALGALALEMAKAEQMERVSEVFAETVRVAQSIENVSVLRAIAVKMAKAGQVEEGLRVAQSIEDASKKASALGALAVEMAKAGQIEEGLQVAQSIEDADWKAVVMGALAVEMAKAGQVEEGLRVAQSIEDVSTLRVIADALTKIGNFNQALNILGQQQIETYLEFIFKTREAFVAHVENGQEVWRRVCVAVLDIVAWVRPSWLSVRAMLA